MVQKLSHQETKFQRNQRHIIKRILIRGNLILDTPTCLGSGDSESPTDLSLLRDSVSNHALLTGASIAGAIRNYLRESEHGYLSSEKRNDLATTLFGVIWTDKDNQENSIILDDGNQSPLIIDDSISTFPIQTELRDGVKINSLTHTAENKAKYDLELLQAGTKFPLCFELLIEEKPDTPNYELSLLKGLAIALQGLEKGEISLGMKKRRGFGRCQVHNWQVWNFNLEGASDRIAWLTLDHSWSTDPPCTKSPAINPSIVAAMKQAGLEFSEEWDDKRDRFIIKATFTLATPLLIRSGQASSDKAPDVVHLKSRRDGELKPVLSGTSLAGVLRHRAERIINTIGKNPSIIEDIFGSDLGKNKTPQARASRLIVHESIIEDTTDLIQNRIAIDRFTGGALHGALFNEQPIFANDKTQLHLELELRKPKDKEIGLLLLLLKDLWTSDLPIGGTSSIGRGRLQGTDTHIILRREQENKTYHIQQSSPKEDLVVNDTESLEKFVATLYEEEVTK
ncbi:hypothetical protein JYQ62_18120 [Nostoc sp. UHCC 0702]|nr:hypothetical protein JYQ62_18120 [Nostoc sp. UHCC 0702]